MTTDNGRIWCAYGARARKVHPDVCEWHKKRKDRRCLGCRAVKMKGGHGLLSSHMVRVGGVQIDDQKLIEEETTTK